MRDFSKIPPSIWTGNTGKQIRRLPRRLRRDCQVLSFYLLTAPNANPLGIYYLPTATLCHEVGISPQGASKALRSLSEVGFAHYDAASEFVYVPNMAKFQLGERLDPSDKRVTWIRRELGRLRNCPFLRDFLKQYAAAYHLEDVCVDGADASPSEGASMGHRSKEIEMEIEKERELSPLKSPQGDAVAEIVELWNHTITRLPRVLKLTRERGRHVAARLREYSVDQLGEAIRRLDASDFAASGGWATFDWLMKSATNVAKITEGNFDNNRNGVRPVARPAPPTSAEYTRALEES